MINSEIIVGTIIVISFFLQGIFGFGGGLISIPLTSIVIGIKNAVTLILFFQLGMGFLVLTTYKNIDWKKSIPIIIGFLIGIPIGVELLNILSPSILRIILAFLIFVYLIRLQFFKDAFFLNAINNKISILLGFIYGIVQGLTGSGGPILVMSLKGIIKDITIFRATLIFIFFSSNIPRVIISSYRGLINYELLFDVLPILPFYLLALWLSQKTFIKLSKDSYEIGIKLILLVSCIGLIYKSTA